MNADMTGGERGPRVGRHITFHGAGVPLELREDVVPDPDAGELLVRVTMGGVCGTDAHRLAGDLPAAGRPISLGHEGIGVIGALGSADLTDRGGAPLRVGDRVYWSPVAPCERCASCVLEEDSSSCERMAWPASADGPNAATFREFATLTAAHSVFRIPDDTPDEAVIAFGCAMPTALAGLERAGQVAIGQTVIVQGCGPVGLAVTLLAHLAGAGRVIVVGAPDRRLALARELGATDTISLDAGSAAERHERILQLNGGRGAGLVVEATGVMPAFGEGLDLLGREATYLVLGLYSGSGTVPIDPCRVNNLNQRIVGSFASRPKHLWQTVGIAQRHHRRLPLADAVTHRFGLDETEQAIAQVGAADAIKVVVQP